MTDDLKKRVRTVVIEYLDVDPNILEDDTSFAATLGLDSLDAMDLLMAVDEAFSVRIPPKEMDGVDSLAQLVAMLEKHLSA
ncbi:MAG: hypothetical protein COB66_03975 [Coxiella sp. (in: Bacteria)]|nr:MAG: hypothetical protein COB66_03975 [Coxiella sp. (in: g-proteobacteria)]